jgi:multidrug resistance efflux pump
MYRQEALDENFESAEEPGNLLNLSPRWLTRAHWLAMSLFLTALLYAMFVNISEYATGPALIRARNKIPVIAAKAGLVRSVEVSVGDHVRIGDLLVRFSDAPGTTTADRVAEQLWAAGNGIIGDIRVRPGQQVNQGEVAATIVDQDAGYEVLGFIPGNYAPQLHPGMPLVLRVQGYQGSSEIMRIDRVGSEILGAQDALRHAGREGGATLPLSGPVVVISAQLHSPKFSQDSRTYRYHDGMSGDIDVSVRSDRLITTVLRGLKNAFAR